VLRWALAANCVLALIVALAASLYVLAAYGDPQRPITLPWALQAFALARLFFGEALGVANWSSSFSASTLLCWRPRLSALASAMARAASVVIR